MPISRDWFNGRTRETWADLRRVRSRYLAGAAALAAAAVLLSCSDSGDPEGSGDVCSPEWQEYEGVGDIGPAGGVVRLTSPGGELEGMQVSVPAGAWSGCWEVSIVYYTIFGTEDYPDGYVPFGRPGPSGSAGLHIVHWTSDWEYEEAPDSLYVEISFPVYRLQRGDFELFSAFYYDDPGASWRVKFPDAIDDSLLTVRTSAWQRHWSWGRIDLAEIDFEQHLEPALAERVGTETWNEIKATVDSVYEAAMRSSWEPITCSALNFGEATFIEARDYSAAMVRAIQATLPCRHCDATTMQFYEELMEYIRLNIAYVVVDIFTDSFRGRLWPLKFAGWGVMGGLLAAMQSLECDYECLVESAPLEFYLWTAGYWSSYVAVQAIQWFKNSGYVNCAPAALTPPLRPAATVGPPAAGMCIG